MNWYRKKHWPCVQIHNCIAWCRCYNIVTKIWSSKDIKAKAWTTHNYVSVACNPFLFIKHCNLHLYILFWWFKHVSLMCFAVFVLRMEPIDPKSRITLADHTSCLNLADSVYTFNDYYVRKVQPTTPCTSNSTQWTFDCLPTPSSEVVYLGLPLGPSVPWYVSWLVPLFVSWSVCWYVPWCVPSYVRILVCFLVCRLVYILVRLLVSG